MTTRLLLLLLTLLVLVLLWLMLLAEEMRIMVWLLPLPLMEVCMVQLLLAASRGDTRDRSLCSEDPTG